MPELTSFFAPLAEWVQNNIHWLLITVIVHFTVLGTVAYLILLERKIASWSQDRIGPNRVGLGFGIIPILKNFRMLGLGQSFADGLKMFTKEDYRPANTDRALFTLAPMMMMAVVIVSIAVIPWGGTVGDVRKVDITNALQSGQTVLASVNEKIPGSRSLQSVITLTRQPAAQGDGEAPKVEPYGVVDASGNVLSGDLLRGDALGTNLRSLATGERIIATYTEGWRFQIAPVNIGVLFVVATLSLAIYGVVIGGYASNNKYSFLGGLRATANMISYEIPLGLSIVCIVLMLGTLDLGQIVAMQTRTLGFTVGDWEIGLPAWNVFTQPVAFVLFLICIHAEANRAPFDTAEAEQELVGGYHTEYSSMRFGMFYLAEYAGMITTSAVGVALFFGGWHLPFMGGIMEQFGVVHDPANASVTSSVVEGILRASIFFGKTLLIVAIFMWTRWSLPRFRFDQIMNLAWKMLIPIGLGLFVTTAIGVFIIARAGGTTVNGLSVREAGLFFLMNLLVVAVTLVVGKQLPTGMETVNKKIEIPGSRYARKPPAIASAS
jgi:NADH-quinone oxidoreductase subunit H